MPKEGGRPAFAITDDDGNYELTTKTQGAHTVAIMAVDETVNAKAEEAAEEFGFLSEVMVPNQKPKQVWRVPEIYLDSETSGLEFEIKRGGDNQADFPLEKK